MGEVRKTKREFMDWIKRSRLFIVYQPIVEISTGKIMAYEALTRAKGKRKAPEKLFQYAYQYGFTPSMDLYCIQMAVSILPVLGKGQKLFVNVEPMTMGSVFRKHEKIDTLLQKTPRKKDIVFELTEGMKSRSFDRVRKGVQFVQGFGCQVALDDIRGIGLKLLELFRYKPKFVKIDMYLIRGLAGSIFHQRMLRALVSLSRIHKADVIAEGVENIKELHLVKKMRIRYAQGHYYAAPKRKLIRFFPNSVTKIA
jgi:EAL domain-containing protein (putative c-di-GMP-specific phosphodiesterase class I)